MLTRRRTPQTQPYITQLYVGQRNVNKIKEKKCMRRSDFIVVLCFEGFNSSS